MLEKIFEPKNKRKIRFATLSSKRKIADKMLDSKKLHQIKQLENLALKKFDKNYIEKLTLLLHNSKNSNNYTVIRNNLNKSVLIFNKTTNEFDVTLPKLNEDLPINLKTEYNLSKKQCYKSFSNNLNEDNSEIIDNNFNNRLVKHKIPTYLNDFIFNQKQKNLFIKSNINLHKDNFHLKTLSNNLPKIQNLNYFNKKLNYKKFYFNKNNNNCNSTKILNNYSSISPKKICGFDENLGKSLIKGNVSHLTNTQKENLKFISELNIFPPKQNIIRKTTKSTYSELCNNHTKKRQRQTELLSRNNDTIKINKINKENRKHINKMISDISKLQFDAKQQEEDVDILIRRNNEFMRNLVISKTSNSYLTKKISNINK